MPCGDVKRLGFEGRVSLAGLGLLLAACGSSFSAASANGGSSGAAGNPVSNANAGAGPSVNAAGDSSGGDAGEASDSGGAPSTLGGAANGGAVQVGGEAGTAPDPGPCDRSGWSASAFQSSGDEESGTSSALDGDLQTRWASGTSQAVGQWFMVTLPKARRLAGITLDDTADPGDQPSAVELDLNGKPALTTTTKTADSIQLAFEPTLVKTFKVKILLTSIDSQGGSPPWWSIDELSVTCAALTQ